MGTPDAVHGGHILIMLIYCVTGPHCQLGQVVVINPYVCPQTPIDHVEPRFGDISASNGSPRLALETFQKVASS